MKKVIVITGPTGVGKTEISNYFAHKIQAEIINADASQFRKGLNVGTAKITENEKLVPHHLLDIISPNDFFSIKDYQKLAREKIELLHKQDKIPMLVGGSGLYIRSALEEYRFIGSGRISANESKYDEYTNNELHDILKELDYKSSTIIHPNNRRRVLRAIEVAKTGEMRISENKSNHQYLYDVLTICLMTERDILYKRINSRTIQMVEQGWIEEVHRLLEDNVRVEDIQEIGYKDVYSYMLGLIDKNTLIDTIAQKTRRYAKKQISWFNNQMQCVFVNMDYNRMDITKNEIDKLILQFLHQNIEEK